MKIKLKTKIKSRIKVLKAEKLVLQQEQQLTKRLINSFKINQNNNIIKELKKLIKT